MKEEIIRFESYDLSAAGFVRPSAIMRRMQQIARDDLADFGITYEDMRAKNMAFVVSKIALDFVRPVQGEVNLVLKSAANPTHGVTFPRSFTLSDEKGVCMRAMSLWALVDFENRSLLRPSALWEEIPSFPDLSDGLLCERLSKPTELPDLSDERRVYPSMLDQNHHLNNCNYADLATDLLPDLCSQVKTLHLTFQHEALLGEVLHIEGFGKEKEYLVSGSFTLREGTCFLCKIHLF